MNQTSKPSVGIILTMALGIFLCMLDTTVMNIALPAIQTGLKTNFVTLSWALNIYTVLFAGLTIPLGRLADMWGRSWVYLIGLGLFFIGSLCSGVAPNVGWLIIGRGVQSVGAAIVFPASMTIGIQSVTLKERTIVIATLGVTQGLAAALGPTIGGTVMALWGWRGIFLVNLPLVILALIGSRYWLNFQWDRHSMKKLDIMGSLLSMVTLFSLTLVLIKGTDWGWHSLMIRLLMGLCLGSLITFIIVEKHTTQPMIPLVLFKNRQFLGAAIVTIISGVFLVALMVLMPSFFTKIQGKSELVAALMITPASIMIFIFSPISGMLLTKVGPRWVIGLGSLAMISGYTVLCLMNPNLYWQFMIAAILVGTGYGIIIGPITVLAAGDFTGELLTASQSVIGVFRQIGTSLAVAIFVSALSTNLTVAKQNVTQYAAKELTMFNINKPIKQDVLGKLKQQLMTEASPKRQTIPIVTKEKTQQLIQTTYQQTLKKQRLITQSKAIKAVVYHQIQQQVTHNVAKTNYRLASATKRIHQQVKIEMTAAFISPYQRAFPFTILLLFTVGVFKKRNQNEAS